jgi:hypothetical protein
MRLQFYSAGKLAYITNVNQLGDYIQAVIYYANSLSDIYGEDIYVQELIIYYKFITGYEIPPKVPNWQKNNELALSNKQINTDYVFNKMIQSFINLHNNIYDLRCLSSFLFKIEYSYNEIGNEIANNNITYGLFIAEREGKILILVMIRELAIEAYSQVDHIGALTDNQSIIEGLYDPDGRIYQMGGRYVLYDEIDKVFTVIGFSDTNTELHDNNIY